MNENSYEFTFESGPLVLPPPIRAFADRDPAESTSLLLLAGPAAVRSGWAAGAAVSLASALAARGRRLVLGDLGLEEPGLHELLGGGNQEGMADIFLYGASLRRVARPAGDGSHYFVPAGPYAPDPAEVMRHPRWDPVLQGLGASGIMLLAYAPSDVAGVEALTERVQDIVVLAEPGEARQVEAVLPLHRAPIATLTPAVESEADALVDALVAEPGDAPADHLNVAADADLETAGADLETAGADFDAAGADLDATGVDLDAPRDLAETAEWPTIEASTDDAGGWPEIELDEIDAAGWDVDRHEAGLVEDLDRDAAPGAEAPTVAGDAFTAEAGEPAAAEAGEPAADANVFAAAEAGVDDERRDEAAAEPHDPVIDRLWQARERRRGESPAEHASEPASPPDKEELLREPGFVAREQQPRKRSNALLLILLVVAIVGSGWLAADRLGVLPLRGTQPVETPTRPATEPAAVDPEPSPRSEFGVSLAEPLGFSVAVEAHQDLALAEERIGMLGEAEPDVVFYLAPISVDNVVYYRVLAGPISESSAAERLMRRLVEAGHKSQVQAWDVRPTAWAYDIGEFAEVEEARARLGELREQGVPAYIVEVPYASATRYRLYAGAYSGPTEAEVMGDILRRAGVQAPFERRMGRPVP